VGHRVAQIRAEIRSRLVDARREFCERYRAAGGPQLGEIGRLDAATATEYRAVSDLDSKQEPQKLALFLLGKANAVLQQNCADRVDAAPVLEHPPDVVTQVRLELVHFPEGEQRRQSCGLVDVQIDARQVGRSPELAGVPGAAEVQTRLERGESRARLKERQHRCEHAPRGIFPERAGGRKFTFENLANALAGDGTLPHAPDLVQSPTLPVALTDNPTHVVVGDGGDPRGEKRPGTLRRRWTAGTR